MQFAQLETTIRSVLWNSPKLLVMGSRCVKTNRRVVLKASGKAWIEPFEIGTTWKVSGHETTEIRERYGRTVVDDVLLLDSAELILHSGDALVKLLSESKRFQGIGRVS